MLGCLTRPALYLLLRGWGLGLSLRTALLPGIVHSGALSSIPTHIQGGRKKLWNAI